MLEHAVAIVGAGPTGLMLAAELALAGVDVAIVERRQDQSLVGQRALGVNARTLEIFDQRGIAQRFLSEGFTGQHGGFAWFHFDMSDFPTRHPYGLGLPQVHIERILAAWVEELGVPVLRGVEVTGLRQDGTGVDADLSDGRDLRAAWLVGCDGGRSLIRKSVGIDFPGYDPTISNLLAEVRVTADPPMGLIQNAQGVHAFGRSPDGDLVRVMVTEQGLAPTGEPTLDDLRRTLTAVFGSDFGAHSPAWISRFTDMTRQAAAYRAGRVLLAGDAAHIHYPAGGQGLNMGLQDAFNLGWKLAQVVKGVSPDSLLDSYQAEQHPVAARVLRNTMAQVALMGRLDDRKAALREVFGEIMALDQTRIHLAGMMSGLAVRYDFGEGHPLLGRRMPDLDLETAGGSATVYGFLHGGRPLLLDLGAAERLDLGKWAERVQRVEARCEGPGVLPVIGQVPAPAAVLVRPDGHVAWTGDGGDTGLIDALARWFGAAD